VILSGANAVEQGQASLLKATITNGGDQPAYRWQDSSSTQGWKDITGANADSLSYTPADGSSVRCLLTSSAECPTIRTVISDPITFSVKLPAGNVDTANGIRYYPNPVISVLTVDGLKTGDDWEKLVVRDLNGGRQVLSYDIRGRTMIPIDMEGLSSGVYVISLLRSSGSNVYIKVLKR